MCSTCHLYRPGHITAAHDVLRMRRRLCWRRRKTMPASINNSAGMQFRYRMCRNRDVPKPRLRESVYGIQPVCAHRRVFGPKSQGDLFLPDWNGGRSIPELLPRTGNHTGVYRGFGVPQQPSLHQPKVPGSMCRGKSMRRKCRMSHADAPSSVHVPAGMGRRSESPVLQA